MKSAVFLMRIRQKSAVCFCYQEKSMFGTYLCIFVNLILEFIKWHLIFEVFQSKEILVGKADDISEKAIIIIHIFYLQI